jgi:hypothetical protein
MVEKLLRVYVAASERGAAAFLRELSGRRAECGTERWRRSDLVAWRNPRFTADMMGGRGLQLPFCRFLGINWGIPDEIRRLQWVGGCL